jgi:hypothetical protein
MHDLSLLISAPHAAAYQYTLTVTFAPALVAFPPSQPRT